MLLKKSGVQNTIVNLWATWCAPCKEEMPELIALRKKLASKGTQLILISADSPESEKEARSFLSEMNVDFTTYRLSESPDAFMKPFLNHWPAVLPTTLAFDKNGKRIGYWMGRISIKDLEKRLNNTQAESVKKTK